MKSYSLIILIVVIVSLAGAFYINQLLQKMIQPRRSIGRLFFYILSAFAIVFGYTFLLVWIIAHLFPLSK